MGATNSTFARLTGSAVANGEASGDTTAGLRQQLGSQHARCERAEARLLVLALRLHSLQARQLPTTWHVATMVQASGSS